MRLCVHVIPVCSVKVPAAHGRNFNGANRNNMNIHTTYACRHITEQILATSYRKIILIFPDDGRVATETCRSHSE